MNIRHDRHGDTGFLQIRDRLCRRKIGHGNADDVASRTLQSLKLGKRCDKVVRVGICHRLNGDRRIAAHRKVADADLSRFSADLIVIHNLYFRLR